MKIINFFYGVVAAGVAWISAQLGILYPVLCVLLGLMIVDYITGMMASKKESLEHPDDSTYGWSSRKGVIGIFKKVGYLCVIAVGMSVDFIIIRVSVEIGIPMNSKAFFGLLVSVWYLLNEALSIIENAGRLDAPVPEWLMKYIAILKNKINTDD